MRLLLLCEFYSVYVVQLWDNLKKNYPDIKISLLTCESASDIYEGELSLDSEEKIYTGPDGLYSVIPKYYDIVRKLPHFDVIQPLWMEKKWGLLAGTIRRRADHIYISVGGSDLYRQAQRFWPRYLQKRLIKRTAVVSSENTVTRNKFYDTYGSWTRVIPHFVVRFGVDVIDSIKERKNTSSDSLKTKWGIPEGKIVVALGYNGSAAHQHFEMIKAIGEMPREVINRCFFIIPMTYGVANREYRDLVEDSIKKVSGDYAILDEYLSTDEMAQIVMLSDVMIHMQTTDQLSSTMMAHLYNGNVVLAGSWLPYSDIKDKGIILTDVDDFECLTHILNDVVLNIEKYKEECHGNKDRVYEFSSWEYCIKDWYGIYSRLVKNTIGNGGKRIDNTI